MQMWLKTEEGKVARDSQLLGLKDGKIRFSRIKIQIDLDKRNAETVDKKYYIKEWTRYYKILR